jgi:hypothetical protein
MATTINVSRNFGSLEEFITVAAEDMREIGLMTRERIVRRTLRGIDARGVPFAPYSPDYFATKAKELGSAWPVNLQVSGNMLNHLQVVEVAENRVTLGWLQ